MKKISLDKLVVEEKKFDLNMKFYFFLKHLVKTKLTGNQSISLLSYIHSKRSFDLKIEEMNIFLESIAGKDKKYHLDIVFSRIQDELDLRLFIFSLKLYMIKDLLLAEANLKSEIELDNLSQLDPLSLKYDDKTLNTPYSTRVSGALLSLCFFYKLENKETNLLSQDSKEYFERLSEEANSLKEIGIEPNQIFMLMF